jgi:hypothetical protein
VPVAIPDIKIEKEDPTKHFIDYDSKPEKEDKDLEDLRKLVN